MNYFDEDSFEDETELYELDFGENTGNDNYDYDGESEDGGTEEGYIENIKELFLIDPELAIQTAQLQGLDLTRIKDVLSLTDESDLEQDHAY